MLAIVPNATANNLMNTAEFEDGQFWLIVDPDYSLKILTNWYRADMDIHTELVCHQGGPMFFVSFITAPVHIGVMLVEFAGSTVNFG